jgi:hypothetical protein
MEFDGGWCMKRQIDKEVVIIECFACICWTSACINARNSYCTLLT